MVGGNISGPFLATPRIDRVVGTEAAVWGPDGDMLALVYGNSGLDWEAMKVAELFANAPTAFALIERAVEGETGDQWLAEARALLDLLGAG